jgi:3-hydroxyisobutyrate dehydrogenase
MAIIGWIGLGHMGIPMSSNMLKAGYTVRGFDIDQQALNRAKAAGIQTVNSIRDAVSEAVAVFTMLPAGPDVYQVLTGHDGVFVNAASDAIIIDCSTIGIEYVKKLHDAARQVNVAFVEAPVSGGTEGATAGNLTFMLGGDHRYIDRVKESPRPDGRIHLPRRRCGCRTGCQDSYQSDYGRLCHGQLRGDAPCAAVGTRPEEFLRDRPSFIG